jgi:putative ABC transport system permease protein
VRPGDIFRIALASLWQQKVRTVLTLLGVVIGSLALTLSVSVGRGVHDQILREFSRFDQFRRIHIWPGFGKPEAEVPPAEQEIHGTMSDAKRERLRQVRTWRWLRTHGRRTLKPLTRDRLQALLSLDHVQSVFPDLEERCWISYEGRPVEMATFVPAPDTRRFRDRLVAGQLPTDERGQVVLVHEYLLYLWGMTDDDAVQSAVGKKLHLEYRSAGNLGFNAGLVLTRGKVTLSPEENEAFVRALRQLPAALDKFDLAPADRKALKKVLSNVPGSEPSADRVLFRGDFTIAGVVREPAKEELIGGWDFRSQEADLFLPVKTAEELFWLAPPNAEGGLSNATVLVDQNEHVKEVAKAIEEQGLHQFSLAEPLEQLQGNVFLVTLGTAGIAVIALLVAAMGITNTMIMSVLQRTREIGIMKAVGARDRHIQLMFLVEGAFLGVLGGVIGLLLSWAVSFPVDGVVRTEMAKQAGHPMEDTILVFPLWLTLGVPAFAGLVTTLAALYPAWRAARVTPVTSLRHE